MAENHLHHGKGIASTQRSSAWPSHATLSLSLFSLSLSHTVPACWQPPWHRGQKSLFPNTANSAWLGARLPACLTPPTPTRGSLRQGYLAVGMGGVAWPSIYYYERRLHWGERREREKGRGERAGESEEEGRGVGGEWRLPPHTPSPQPFNQLFFFFNHSQRLRHQRTREWTHVKIRLHRMGSACVCACATPWKRGCPSYLIHLSILVRRCDAALLLRQPWYTHTHTNAHAPESLACTTASSSLA